jgi:hypothetical protein
MKLIKNRQAFFGDIWSIQTEPPRKVVILAGDQYPIDFESPQVEVALISEEINQAADNDLILDQLMVEFWNRQFILVKDLNQLEGQLSPEQIDQLTRLSLSWSNDGTNISDLTFGSKIVDESDPRLAFQERERQLIHPLAISIFSLLAEREEMRAQVIDQWQQERELEAQTVSIDWPSQQVEYISRMVQAAVRLPEYTSRLRLNEIALAALVEAHTNYELGRLDQGQQEDLVSFEPIFRLDTTPARSTLFDIGLIAINGHRINVRPAIEDGWILIDRRLFYQQLSDYFVGVGYQAQTNQATIFGYLSQADAETLQTDYDRRLLALDVQQFLPVSDLYRKLATAAPSSASPVVLKPQFKPINFDQLDLSLLVSELPDEVYLQLLQSETEAEKYIQARLAFDQAIRTSRQFSTPPIELIGSKLTEIFQNSVDSFRDFITAPDRLNLAAAGESPQSLVFDCASKQTFPELEIQIGFYQHEFDFSVIGLPTDLAGYRFSILIFDQQAKQQFKSPSSLIKLQSEGDFLPELTAYLANLETEDLPNHLRWMVTEIECPQLIPPPSKRRVDADGNILFGIDNLKGDTASTDDFLILLYPDNDAAE